MRQTERENREEKKEKTELPPTSQRQRSPPEPDKPGQTLSSFLLFTPNACVLSFYCDIDEGLAAGWVAKFGPSRRAATGDAK